MFKNWTHHRCSKLKRLFTSNNAIMLKSAVCQQDQLGKPVTNFAVEIVKTFKYLEVVQDSKGSIDASTSKCISHSWTALGVCKSILSYKLFFRKTTWKNLYVMRLRYNQKIEQ